jgi:adenylate cyclase
MAEVEYAPPASTSKLEALARLSAEVSAADNLDERITEVLASLSRHFGYDHSMLLVPADDGRELQVVACHGYPGGVGASVPFGQGAIGVCAERRRPIRLNNVVRDLGLARASQAAPDHRAIPLPGLPNVGSQAAVAASVEDRLALVLYAEDEAPGRFGSDDTHALEIVAHLLAVAMRDAGDDAEPGRPALDAQAKSDVAPLRVRFYESDGSVFFDDEYVIKSVPGRILYRLLKARLDTGRTEFTKKELRLDANIKLPAVQDNLDARLILLRRRLAERFPCVELVPVARGRFALRVTRRFEVVEACETYPLP